MRAALIQEIGRVCLVVESSLAKEALAPNAQCPQLSIQIARALFRTRRELLADCFDVVADQEAGAGDWRADGGGVVHIGGFDDADGAGEAADHVACGGVFDLLGYADHL